MRDSSRNRPARSWTAPGTRGDSQARSDEPQAGGPADDAELEEEVRQLVVARNERRARRGEQPLDVEAEVERRLRELKGLAL